MDSDKLLIQLNLLHKSSQICLSPFINSTSTVAKDYYRVLLYGQFKKDFVVCKTCHKVLKFVSIDRSYSSLKAHRNRCQKKIKSDQSPQSATQPQQADTPQAQQNQISPNQP